MRRLTSFVLAAVAVLGLTLVVGAGPAGAATQTSIVWGHSYSHKSYRFHQVSGHPGPLALHSADGSNDFVVNASGDLSTSRLFYTGYKGSWWYPYWRSHTDGKGVYFSLQTDGNLVERKSDNRTVVWKSGKYLTAGKYNFALYLGNSGDLTEYYSSGNPLASGHHVLWHIGRVVGSPRDCGGGGLDAGTTEAKVLVQNGVFTVWVHNVNVLPLPVTVYRWWGGQQVARSAAYVAPYTTHTFGKNWYVLDNLPEVVTMRAETTAQSVLGAFGVHGYCWYKA